MPIDSTDKNKRMLAYTIYAQVYYVSYIFPQMFEHRICVIECDANQLEDFLQITFQIAIVVYVSHPSPQIKMLKNLFFLRHRFLALPYP